MEDMFRQFWWLIFPLSWFVFGAYQSWLSYRANRDTLDLIKTYAQAGREPPPELLAKLSKRWNDGDDLDEVDEDDERYRRRRHRRAAATPHLVPRRAVRLPLRRLHLRVGDQSLPGRTRLHHRRLRHGRAGRVLGGGDPGGPRPRV
jgi:hypothetical protein